MILIFSQRILILFELTGLSFLLNFNT